MERWLKAKQGSSQKKEQPETSLRSYEETEREDTLEECLELQCTEPGVGGDWAGEEQDKSDSILKRRTEESQHSKCNGKRRSLNTQKGKYTQEMLQEESVAPQTMKTTQTFQTAKGERRWRKERTVFYKFTNI